MHLREGKVDNRGISIHYIESVIESVKVPLVFIPGFTESAEDYIEIMKAFDDRKCVAITLRGRGQSDAPESGYTLEDHVSDIKAVVDYLTLDDICILGYSRGASYMIDYALGNLSKIKCLIVGDYPGMHTRLVERWVEMFVSLPPWRGKTALERMPRHAIEAIQRESVEKLFYEPLKVVKVPVLLLKGEKKGSMVSEEALTSYFDAVEDMTLSVFEGCDHDLFKPDASHFIHVVKGFLDQTK